MARKFPPEAYQLAETYQLGTPVKRHIGLGWLLFYSGMIALFFLGWVAFTIAAFTAPGMMNYLFVSCLELILLGGLAIYVVFLFVVLSRYAYACTNGFVEVNRKTRQVRHVLHWNDVASTSVSSGRSLPTYYVTDLNGKKFEVPYHAIWRQCKHASAKRAAVKRQRQ